MAWADDCGRQIEGRHLDIDAGSYNLSLVTSAQSTHWQWVVHRSSEQVLDVWIAAFPRFRQSCLALASTSAAALSVKG
jgi:hypothetical protein